MVQCTRKYGVLVLFYGSTGWVGPLDLLNANRLMCPTVLPNWVYDMIHYDNWAHDVKFLLLYRDKQLTMERRLNAENLQQRHHAPRPEDAGLKFSSAGSLWISVWWFQSKPLLFLIALFTIFMLPFSDSHALAEQNERFVFHRISEF